LFSSTKKRIVAAAVGVTTVLGASAAFAYWTSSGSGTGAASVGNATTFEVTTDAPVGAPLTPGGTAQSVGINVKNPGTGSQAFSQVVVKVANADGTPWTAVDGCTAADFAVGGAAAGGPVTLTTSQEIAAGATNGTQSVSVQMVNRDASQDACKGVTVPLHVAVS
jgi:hypothetical protein